MSRIVTFYSYKGGVGRTFALANIAVLLAHRGHRVLIVDWDLEAPGLHRYFQDHLPDVGHARKGLAYLLEEASKGDEADWRSHVVQIALNADTTLTLLSSGDHSADYADLVRGFDWTAFFSDRAGGVTLERWRNEWKEAFDFVLVDSRTGITDAGGVCTILLPDILVFVFAANEQSFGRGREVVFGIQRARRELSVPRPPVGVLPLLGRFDGRDEVDDAARWLDRFAADLTPFYDEWLPKRFKPREILEITKIPYIAKFSFGEPLPVLSHGVRDPDGPGFYLEKSAALIESDFRSAFQLLAPAEKRSWGALESEGTLDLLLQLLVDDVAAGKVKDILGRSRQLIVDGQFEEARAMLDALPDKPAEIATLRSAVLQQIEDAQTQHDARENLQQTVSALKNLVTHGKFGQARILVDSLPNDSAEISAFKEHLLTQVDQAEEQDRLEKRIREVMEDLRRLVEMGRFDEARKRVEALPSKPAAAVTVRDNLRDQIDQAEKGYAEMIDGFVKQADEWMGGVVEQSVLREGLVNKLRIGLAPQKAAEVLIKEILREPGKYTRSGSPKSEIRASASWWNRLLRRK